MVAVFSIVAPATIFTHAVPRVTPLSVARQVLCMLGVWRVTSPTWLLTLLPSCHHSTHVFCRGCRFCVASGNVWCLRVPLFDTALARLLGLCCVQKSCRRFCNEEALQCCVGVGVACIRREIRMERCWMVLETGVQKLCVYFCAARGLMTASFD